MIRYYSTTGVPYIPFSEMLEKFRDKFPENKIDIKVIPDMNHEPNTFCATATLWPTASTATETNYMISVTARRGPSDATDEDSSEVTPYDAVQVAALRKALILLGFGIPVEEAERLRNEYLEKISNVEKVETVTKVEEPTPAEIPSEANRESTTTAIEDSVKPETEAAPVEPQPEAPVEKPKKDISSKKSTTKADSKNIADKKVEKKQQTSAETAAIVEADSNMTFEEAWSMPCDWQSREETLGELYESEPELFNWMAKSKMYAKKHPREYAAVQLICKLKNS